MSGNRVKHRVRRGVCALLTAALLAPVWDSALPVGAVTQSEIDALKARQAESQERQAELEEQLTRAEADRDAAREQRQLLGQQLERHQRRAGEHQRPAYLVRRGDRPEGSGAPGRPRPGRRRQYELFCQRVRAMEEEGRCPTGLSSSTPCSFSELLDRLADVDAVMAYDNRVMDELIAAPAGAGGRPGPAGGGPAAEPAAKEAQEAVKARQQEKVAQAQALLDELNADVAEVQPPAGRGGRVVGRHRGGDRPQAAAAGGAAEQNNVQLPPAGNGWMWPLPSANMKLTSAFGFRMHPVDHVPHSHTGIDVAASTGTPIYAARGGQVIMSEYGTGSTGLTATSWSSTTGTAPPPSTHTCPPRAVSEGELVQQGQTIGAVGTTGNVKGAHLHLRCASNGQRTDPEAYYTGLPLIRAYNW